jgi:hypothetical protein
VGILVLDFHFSMARHFRSSFFAHAIFLFQISANSFRYHLYGTADCGALLWDQSGTPVTTYCGVFDPTAGKATYGGCRRLDVDEGTLTGATGNGVTTANPTALFNQAIEAFGGIRSTAGITFAVP